MATYSPGGQRVPEVGEVWGAVHGTSPAECLGYDPGTGKGWFRFLNNGDDRVYPRNTWNRWTPPEEPLPLMPDYLWFFYERSTNGVWVLGYIREWKKARKTMRSYLRHVDKYRVLFVDLKNPSRTHWYTLQDFEDDEDSDEDDD